MRDSNNKLAPKFSTDLPSLLQEENHHSSLTLSAPIRVGRQGSAQAVLGVFEKLKAVGLVTLTID